MPSYDRTLWALRTWLDCWAGIGHVAVGMHRQGFDLQLTQYDERGWRATFYTTGIEHSPTRATGTGLGAHAVARYAAGGVGGLEESGGAVMGGCGSSQGPSSQGPSPIVTPRTAGDAVSIALTGEKAVIKISPLFEALLNSADGLLTRVNQPSAAVLVAQTAIEVCTARLIGKLLDKLGASILEYWIDNRLQNYNIANETVRSLYQALSSDTQIAQQSFWQRLQSHVQLRNDIAHEGRFATQAQGQASLAVTREVIEYLTSIAAQHAIALDT
jgi:hypothetical protein